ncbi:hypothetical protein [Nemorincola caseinilytica]
MAKAGIVLYLLINLAATFYFHFHNPLDGDVVLNALPADIVKPAANDPFGIGILLHGHRYVGAGGYLAHITVHKYFRILPAFFRHFVSPIDSVYATVGLFAMVLKAAFLYLFCIYITGRKRLFDRKILLAALLITPLFQVGGYSFGMGIVDPMIIVDFNYSFINFCVMLFFLPFFMSGFYGKEHMSVSTMVGLAILGIYIGINGPLAGPLLCIVYCFVLFALWLQHFRQAAAGTSLLRRFWGATTQIPIYYWVLGIIILLASAYCRFLTLHNAEGLIKQISIQERYSKMWTGLGIQFSIKGYWLLSAMVVLNVVLLLRRKGDERARQLLSFFAWVMLFNILYTVMLPLGGYRFYRPYIIRRDVFSPVTTSLALFYGMSAFYLLRAIPRQHILLYRAYVAIPLIHFASVSFNAMPDNSCEKNALRKIAASKERVVALDEQCPIMAWEKITDTTASKDLTAMLRIWQITKEDKVFYQK